MAGEHRLKKPLRLHRPGIEFTGAPVSVRIGEADGARLLDLLTIRYPHEEWGTFGRFGWDIRADGGVVTLASLLSPEPGDLDIAVGNVAIQEPYSLRAALTAEHDYYAVGVIHSHPENFGTGPSGVDDEMDAYYSAYFHDFAPDRPYVSLILAHDHNTPSRISGTGRVFWRSAWHPVGRIVIGTAVVPLRGYSLPNPLTNQMERQLERLRSAFGAEAAQRLARARVGVVGLGGTGSPAVEAFARAGVGGLVLVDPDYLVASNIERVHGSFPQDAAEGKPKALVAKEHVAAINPDADVIAIVGALPQKVVIEALSSCDIVIGATDKHYGRVALTEFAERYLVPVIDIGVNLEGAEGFVTGQPIQLLFVRPGDPCIVCRKAVDFGLVTQELMSHMERERRREAANFARRDGGNAEAYWHEEAQLNTVGYLTTVAGAMAAGYAIGLVTQRFRPPFSRLQLDLSSPLLGCVTLDVEDEPADAACVCRKLHGLGSVAPEICLISPPSHWLEPYNV